jgi:Zn ribbon nucleic-acid-binding protein
MLAVMDDKIPVVVRMRVECDQCGHTENETYHFGMAFGEAQPMEEYAPGICPKCRAPIQIHLRRTQQVQ